MSATDRRGEPNHPSITADQRRLLSVEREIQERLRGEPLDFASMLAVSNIYRAAATVRRQAEREVLSEAGLSWGGFTILWVLWIWGEMETAHLAAECDLAKGTLTGMLTTLEKRDLVSRRRQDSDRRRVAVSLTDTGRQIISELFPRFNGFESQVTDGLSDHDKGELARLLRLVIANASVVPPA